MSGHLRVTYCTARNLFIRLQFAERLRHDIKSTVIKWGTATDQQLPLTI